GGGLYRGAGGGHVERQPAAGAGRGAARRSRKGKTMKAEGSAAAGLPVRGMVAVALALVAGLSSGAQPARQAYRSAAEIIAAAPDSHWRQPDPANLLFMQVNGGIVIIELAPRFAPGHVA